MSDAASDRVGIERVAQLYIDGTRAGDAAKLRDAFHDDARMFGSLGGQRVDVPISELFAMSDGKPADVDGSYHARIVALEHVGDAATATIEEDGFWGNVSFTDFLALARIGGDRKDRQQDIRAHGGRATADVSRSIQCQACALEPAGHARSALAMPGERRSNRIPRRCCRI